VVLFQVVTLPVEFNASSRAMAALEKAGILSGEEELSGARSVLNAAAMTYVAAAVSSALQLVYFMIRSGMLGGRDD
jgi:Zn-dependent membrane protease YugP